MREVQFDHRDAILDAFPQSSIRYGDHWVLSLRLKFTCNDRALGLILPAAYKRCFHVSINVRTDCSHTGYLVSTHIGDLPGKNYLAQ